MATGEDAVESASRDSDGVGSDPGKRDSRYLRPPTPYQPDQTSDRHDREADPLETDYDKAAVEIEPVEAG